MRILIVCRSFPAHRAGGVEAHTRDVVEGLVAAGHQVSIITSPLPAQPAVAPLVTNGSITTVGGRADGRYDLRFVRELASAVRSVVAGERIDVIHAQGFAGVVLARAGRALGAPLVTTIHGTHWSETLLDRRTWRGLSWGQRAAALWRYRARVATWPMWRGFLASKPHLVVDSTFTHDELLGEQPRLPAPVVVPLGFVDGSPRRVVESTAPPTMVCVGRLESIKGFDTVIAAAGSLSMERDWRLVIVGSGPDEARLRQLAQEGMAGEHIVFAGRLDDDAKQRALDEAALVLVPDRGQPAFGLAVAEALCAGVPVLASRVGAHGEVLVDERDGELIEAAATTDWADAMQRWLTRAASDDLSIRCDRAERARQRFARARMIERLVEVYQGVRTGHASPDGAEGG